MVLLLLAPALDFPIMRVVSECMGSAVGFGVAVFFLLPVAAVLFLVVVVAIPLGAAPIDGFSPWRRRDLATLTARSPQPQRRLQTSRKAATDHNEGRGS